MALFLNPWIPYIYMVKTLQHATWSFTCLVPWWISTSVPYIILCMHIHIFSLYFRCGQLQDNVVLILMKGHAFGYTMIVTIL